jgi:transketolase
MRTTFFRSLEGLYRENDDIVVLTADLGFKLFDAFGEHDPERFYDMGIAEANMIGVSAGLSLSGKNVYSYSIIPFLVMRAYEQIRIDISYHNLNVKLVGVGGGFTYGLEGITHYGLEDMTLMRSLSNMSVVVPADSFEAAALAKISYEHKGPMYIRLGRTGDPCVYEQEPDFTVGKAMILTEGKDVALFAVGNMVYEATQVVLMLAKKGISATLVNMHTIKPIDEEVIRQVASIHHSIFTIEEHYTCGGLGSAVAEVLAESNYGRNFVRIGIKIDSVKSIGTPGYLRKVHGLTPESIYEKVLNKIKET